ncbi:MAG: ABC transporter ATP-binding protein, partial [Propionibacterium sp.]|nr:ABC transporter ATP-binding protein [Propionibacterium sp.]
MPDNTATPIVLEKVTKRFSPTVLGLDDFSASFEQAKVTVLLGLSGSGKS